MMHATVNLRLPLVCAILAVAVSCAGAQSPGSAAAAAPTAARATAPGATAGAALCSLNIQGNGKSTGLQAASLSCTGGTITVAAHRVLQQFWGTQNPQGVKFSTDTACSPSPQCMLSICGQSNAVFIIPNATDVMQDEDLAVVLCVNGNSTVSFRSGTFSSNTLMPLGVYFDGTSALVDQCQFRNNIIPPEDDAFWPAPSSMLVNQAAVQIQATTFFNNSASGADYGGISAINAAKLIIRNCTFEHNKAESGAAVNLESAAEAKIYGSRFSNNEASEYGGAISTCRCTGGNTTKLEILPDKQAAGTMATVFFNNSAGTAGGDIQAAGSAFIAGAKFYNSTATGAGAVLANNRGNMTLVDVVVSGAEAGQDGGGCVAAFESAAMTITNSNLANCISNTNAGGAAVVGQAKLVLSNVTIENNTAEGRAANGGGVYAAGSSTLMLDTVRFFNNSAADSGGGLVLYEQATLIVQRPSVVVNNTAAITGGGLRIRSGKFTPDQVSGMLRVTNNTAPVARDISYAAWSIEVVDKGSAEELITSDGKEGVLTMVLNVSGPHGLPSDDQIAYNEYNANNKPLTEGTLLTGVGDTVKTVSLRFKHEPGTYFLTFLAFWDATVNVRQQVNVIPCPPGHVTGGRNDTCNPCPKGLFSFSPADAECTVCPANANCPGLDKVWPLSGWWHSAPQSINIQRCFNKDACLGGEAASAAASRPRHAAAAAAATATKAGRLLRGVESGTDRTLGASANYTNMQCAPGYAGNLCGVCEKGWGKTRPFFCRQCMPAGVIAVLHLLGALAVLGVVKLMVYFQLSDMGEREDVSRPLPAEMLRALVIHCQWLYILGSMVGIPWPDSLLIPFQIIGGLWSSTSGSSIGLECILNRDSRVPVAIQKLLLCLFTPAVILCAVLLIEVVLHFVNHLRKSGQKRIGHDFAGAVICIVFIFLPTWVKTALSLFTCVSLDAPVEPPYQAYAVGSYWVEDMSQQCYRSDGYHKGWALGLGIPLTLLFCVALPAGVFRFMWFSRRHDRLSDSRFQKHYGFMFRLYRVEVCWWESVVLLQTVALVMVSTFGFAMGPYYQALVSAAVLALVAILLLAIKPYRCPAANTVAVLSVCVLLFTVYVALTFLPYNSVSPGPVYGNVMGAVLLLANVAFLAYTLWKLVAAVNWKGIGSVVSLTLSQSLSVGSEFLKRPAASKDPEEMPA